MNCFIMLTSLLFCLFNLSPAIAADLSLANASAPVIGYGVEDLIWTVTPAVAGAQPVNITGLLEDVLTYQNYPFPTITTFNESSNATAKSTTRDNSEYCYNFPAGNAQVISKGSQYLNGLTGSGANGPGPGNCGKVSCSYDSAIWWCNDNDYTLTIPYSYMGAAASHVLSHCYDSVNHFGLVSGQTFYTGGWNIIIRDDEGC